MRVVVTGASGFIGSAVCEILESRGLEVDRWSRTERRGYRRVPLSEVETVAAELASVEATHIVHCGGTIPSKADVARLSEYLETDIRGTLALAFAAREAGVGQLVLIGSAAEYGDVPPPQGPRSAEKPTQPYGLQKLATTRAVLALSTPGFSVVVLRPFTVYGPSQAPGMLIPDAIRAMRTGSDLVVGHPSRVRDWIHVADVARAVVAALETKMAGVALPIGRGIPISVEEMLKTLARVTGEKLRWRSESGTRAGDVESLVADAGTTTATIGWQAEIDLESGLRHTLAAADTLAD